MWLRLTLSSLEVTAHIVVSAHTVVTAHIVKLCFNLILPLGSLVFRRVITTAHENSSFKI